MQGEQSGTLPTKEWKLKNVGEQWYLGDTYHYGIGQGFLLVTPLQVNAWTQVIANGGKLYQPHLLKNQEPTVKNQDLLDEKSVNLIREGMVGSCNPGGEAWPLYGFKVKNAKLKVDGKTGIWKLDPQEDALAARIDHTYFRPPGCFASPRAGTDPGGHCRFGCPDQLSFPTLFIFYVLAQRREIAG